MSTIVLTGLRADNPLGFLAALGTLRVLTLADPERPPRMGWVMHGGAWRPVVDAGFNLTEEAFSSMVDAALQMFGGRLALDFADDTCIAPDVFRRFVLEAARQATADDRRKADFCAAFGCEAYVDRQGRVSDTALRTMSGAGNQHFVAFMRSLCDCTNRDHVHEALFGPWRWNDPPPSMRWDPVDDRRYALRWRDPKRDKIKTVRGANRLAIEGLAMFSTVPRVGGVETMGFREREWLWPVWEPLIPQPVVQSLLGLAEMYDRPIPTHVLRPLGVVAVLRSQRRTVGQYRNFSPARRAD